MKILLILYMLGVICGIVGNWIIRLEVTSYIKEKKKQGAISKVSWQTSLAASIKTIVQILMPIYHYFILFGAMVTPREKLLESVDNFIKKQNIK